MTQIAKVIKDELKNINYKMPWSQGLDDLCMSNFKTPQLLDRFLTSLLEPNSNTSVVDCVKSSAT